MKPTLNLNQVQSRGLEEEHFMDKTGLSTTFLGRILTNTGEFFLLLAGFFSQLIPSLLVIPLAIFVQTNAELTGPQVRQASLFTAVMIVSGNILLLAWIHFSNKQARKQIKNWLEGIQPDNSKEELQAWKQITSCSWRFGIVSLLISIFIETLPLAGFMILTLKVTSNQLLYTIMGSIVFASVAVALGMLLIERLLAPVRAILLPAEFENQLSGSTGARILTKLLIVIFIMVLVSVLLVAPVGYHSTITVLVNGLISTQGALRSLQYQSLVAAFVALLLGFGLSLLLSRSVSDPIHQIIGVLNKVENGDLKQRANVTATDEIGELAMHFNRMISRLDTLAGTLESQVAERTEQLKATVEVSRVVSTILDPDELITKVVNLITDRFGYYYTAIFLIDESERWAVLREATGTAGQTLKSSGHRLPLGGKSMVATAIATRNARIALDVGSEPVRFENPLLPDTRSEIALPLLVAGNIIGALDVQSKQEAAFTEQDIDILQGMANSVATALENARLFRETQKNLDELRVSQREYVVKAWSETTRESEGYDYASPEAIQTGSELSMIDVPLTLREQIIGQLHLEGQQDWTPEERNLVEAVATQAALAMENARLLEESRRMALRERLAAEITGKVWSSANTDFILQTAVKELGRALRADEATIELKMD
ncbi:MAG: GAF domain-containing protein [Anaerolineales bacterium]